MFSIDSKFYTLTTYVYHLFIVNLLFLLTSILVFTIPSSFIALVATVRKLNSPKLISRYFQNLRKNAFSSIPIGMFNLLSILFVRTSDEIVISNSLFLRGMMYVFLVFLLTYNITLYVILVMEKEKITYYQLFQQSFIWNMVLFYRLFLLFLIFGLIGYFLFLRFPILIILFGISLPMYCYVHIFNMVIKKNIIERAERI